MKINALAFLGAGLVALLPAVSSADNLTIANAGQYVVGQGWITMAANAVTGRFYQFGVVPGRSYCAETAAGDLSTDNVDTTIYLYDTSQMNFAANDDNTLEPTAALATGAGGPFGPSRACWIAAPGETTEYLQVLDATGGGVPRRIRVSDTSLWAPWFFSGNGFEAFLLIQNTTNQDLTVAVTLRQTNGTPNGATQTATIPANGDANFQLSAAPFFLSAATGNVQISHTGAPGALLATVTSISFGNGVSFDVPASPRQDYRH